MDEVYYKIWKLLPIQTNRNLGTMHSSGFTAHSARVPAYPTDFTRADLNASKLQTSTVAIIIEFKCFGLFHFLEVEGHIYSVAPKNN